MLKLTLANTTSCFLPPQGERSLSQFKDEGCYNYYNCYYYYLHRHRSTRYILIASKLTRWHRWIPDIFHKPSLLCIMGNVWVKQCARSIITQSPRPDKYLVYKCQQNPFHWIYRSDSITDIWPVQPGIHTEKHYKHYARSASCWHHSRMSSFSFTLGISGVTIKGKRLNLNTGLCRCTVVDTVVTTLLVTFDGQYWATVMGH